MKSFLVRLSKVKILNFKNIKFGEISLINQKTNYRANVLGLYGQNGSGKTALIDSLNILKSVLSGAPISSYYTNLINVTSESDSAEFEFEFELKDDSSRFNVSYSFAIKRELDEEKQVVNNAGNFERIVVLNEKIKCPHFSKQYENTIELGKQKTLIDTSDQDMFTPRSKRELLLGKNKNTQIIVAKKLAFAQSKSFIFSRDLIKEINDVSSTKSNNDEFNFYFSVIHSLINYGIKGLFVISSATSVLANLQI